MKFAVKSEFKLSDTTLLDSFLKSSHNSKSKREEEKKTTGERQKYDKIGQQKLKCRRDCMNMRDNSFKYFIISRYELFLLHIFLRTKKKKTKH